LAAGGIWRHIGDGSCHFAWQQAAALRACLFAAATAPAEPLAPLRHPTRGAATSRRVWRVGAAANLPGDLAGGSRTSSGGGYQRQPGSPGQRGETFHHHKGRVLTCAPLRAAHATPRDGGGRRAAAAAACCYHRRCFCAGVLATWRAVAWQAAAWRNAAAALSRRKTGGRRRVLERRRAGDDGLIAAAGAGWRRAASSRLRVLPLFNKHQHACVGARSNRASCAQQNGAAAALATGMRAGVSAKRTRTGCVTLARWRTLSAWWCYNAGALWRRICCIWHSSTLAAQRFNGAVGLTYYRDGGKIGGGGISVPRLCFCVVGDAAFVGGGGGGSAHSACFRRCNTAMALRQHGGVERKLSLHHLFVAPVARRMAISRQRLRRVKPCLRYMRLQAFCTRLSLPITPVPRTLYI